MLEHGGTVGQFVIICAVGSASLSPWIGAWGAMMPKPTQWAAEGASAAGVGRATSGMVMALPALSGVAAVT
jgi:hypothetical protein